MQHFFIAIEQALQSGNYYAALTTALALPDICGWIENPSIGSKARYVAWFEKYVQDKYTRQPGYVVAGLVFLSGSDCYALRCAYLH